MPGNTEETGPRTTTYAWDGETEAPESLADSKWRTTVSVVNGAGEDLFSATKLGAEGRAWIISGWKERDQRGRVATIADAFYSAVLPITRDPSAPLQSVSYDALDRPLVQTLPNGGKKSMLYKAFETQITASQQAPVTTFLDGLGRVMHTTRTVNGDAEEVVAQYDAADRILKMTLQGGLAVHEFKYDSLGRLVRAEDNDIGVRTMSYNDHNWLLRHTNGAQQTVGFDYDGAGRLTRRFEVATPEQSALRPPVEYRFFYDERPETSEGIGDVTNLGACRTSAGDLKGRLSWVFEPQGLSCFGYDELGRQNLRQRVIYKGKGDRNGDHVESVTRSRFSFSGTLVEESYGDGFAAAPAYDGAGRLIAVASPGQSKPYWETPSLDASGRVLNETYANGVEQAYERDELGMPRDIQIQRPRLNGGGLETIFHTTIERNLYGAPTVIKDLDGHGLDHSATYGYDPAARLTTATVGSATAKYTFRYAYDGLQNMIRRAASGPRADLGVMVGFYRHDAPAHPRRLKQVDSPLSSLCGPQEAVASFAYDNAGRMIQQSARALEFDGFDQLLKVAEPQVPAVEYAYGFDGFRTWRSGPGVEEYWFAPGDILRGGVPEHVITVGDRLVARVRAGVNGAAAAGNFVWVMPKRIGRLPMAELYALLLMAAFGLGLAVLAAVESRKRRRWAPAGAAAMVLVLLGAMGLTGCGQAINRTGQAWSVPDVTFVHHGVAAGPVLFTKGDGSVFDERRYEPFGGDIDSYREDGSNVTGIDYAREPQNVLNKETDTATGWSYHGARWMSANLARWVSPDPPVKVPDPRFIKEPWAINPYQYVEQTPTIFWDSDGRDKRTSTFIVGDGGASVILIEDLSTADEVRAEASKSKPVNRARPTGNVQNDPKMSVAGMVPLAGLNSTQAVVPDKGREKRHFVLPHVARALNTVGVEFAKRTGGNLYIRIGDASKEGGGPIGHLSHQRGIDIDIRIVVETSAAWDKRGGSRRLTYNDPAYNRDATFLLIDLLLAQKDADVTAVFFDDRKLVDVFRASGERRVGPDGAGTRHDDHLHIRFSPVAPRSQ